MSPTLAFTSTTKKAGQNPMWFRVDDKLWGHPKWVATPPAARALWVTAGSWCSANLTDGHVPRAALPILGGKPKDAAALIAAGLWDAAPAGGWIYHDWDEFQLSREEQEERKVQARDRMRDLRDRRRSREQLAN